MARVTPLPYLLPWAQDDATGVVAGRGYPLCRFFRRVEPRTFSKALLDKGTRYHTFENMVDPASARDEAD